MNETAAPSTLEEWPRDKDDPLYWQMRQENDDFLRRCYWQRRHWLNGTLKNQRQREAQRLSREAERIVDDLVQQMGYHTARTTHKCPFDLWVQDEAGRAARVEVKISRYCPVKKGRGRYQCDVRHHDQADVLVFIARTLQGTGNGRDWPFVIPMADIAPRQNLAIWSYHPEAYKGQWAIYLKAWEHLHQAIKTAPVRPQQLTLF